MNNETFIMELPLIVEKFQSDELDKRFEILRRIYNMAQNKLERQFCYLSKFKEYQECTTKKAKGEFIKKHPFSFKDILDKSGNPLMITFTKYDIQGYLSKFAKLKIDSQYTYSDMGINTSMLMHMGMAIWSAWEKVIFDSKADKISYKKYGDLKSIGVDWEPKHPAGFILNLQKGELKLNLNNRQGQYARYITMKIRFGRKEHQVWYEGDALNAGEDSIRVLTIVRRKIRGRYNYYLQMTIRNNKPQKGRTLGEGRVAIDLGTSKIAVVAKDKVHLLPLSPSILSVSDELRIIQRQMDRSRRANNPQKYHEDGTVKKGNHDKWVNSKEYIRLRNMKAELERKQAAVRKQDHIALANYLLSLGNEFVIEDNDVQEWAKRKKEEKRRKSDGKNLSKAGLGKQIGNHAPSMFVTILKNKVESLGGTFVKVDNNNRATDYDFTNNTFNEHKLEERYITLGNGNRHQRDTLAAFNLYHLDTASEKGKCYNLYEMRKHYAQFCEFEKEALLRWKGMTPKREKMKVREHERGL